ncbi:hypothetical protein [Streptomyces sp. H39-S7]|uniref:hypothetical protein n=1 Tax=Streptomyces sp. H39-S7 TaxID=3004357 RepID=UPI0022AF5769|nr:hypothetical protein [Streptomyces sp. H39-S7]MCZ4125523.1 hypothetical protein [Streptomyces sp. H39-S7]
MTSQNEPQDARPVEHDTVRLSREPKRLWVEEDTTPQIPDGYRSALSGTAHELSPSPVPDILLRFGPGVPTHTAPEVAAVWHGHPPTAPARTRPRRSLRRYTLAGVVLLAVLAFLLWERLGAPLGIDSVSVTSAPARVTCGGTEVVTATVRTNGWGGNISYHWVRSDGTDSGPQKQYVRPGEHQVQLPERWTVVGRGTFRGTTTLWITTPGRRGVAAIFDYSCQ